MCVYNVGRHSLFKIYLHVSPLSNALIVVHSLWVHRHVASSS